MCRRTARNEQVSQRRQHILVFELPGNDKCQALPAGLIDDGQDPELAAIVRAPFDEVVGPHMPGILRP